MPFIFNPLSGSFDYYESGSAGNSFTIWQPPHGTSPTAASSTDTMTLTSSDSSIVITGNSSTDTIDFKLAWTPLKTTACKLMFESDVKVTNSSGSAIAWEDQASGETVTTFGASPTIVSNQLNGLPILRFNGSTQALAGSSADYNDDSRAFSCYVVCKPTAFSGTQYYIPFYLPNSGGAGKAAWLLLTNDATQKDVSWADTNPSPSGANINSGNLSLSSAAFQVIRVFYNGQGPKNIANYSFRIGSNSVSSGVTSSNAAEISGTSRICVGCRSISNDVFFNGDLAAIYYFNTDNIANGVDTLMTAYLLAKYGIS